MYISCNKHYHALDGQVEREKSVVPWTKVLCHHTNMAAKLLKKKSSIIHSIQHILWVYSTLYINNHEPYSSNYPTCAVTI